MLQFLRPRGRIKYKKKGIQEMKLKQELGEQNAGFFSLPQAHLKRSGFYVVLNYQSGAFQY